ncbi:tripartite tricarboxylate transporter substrate binding protein [Bosea sp. LjRoot9]|uniref:Bug family tripartite tricarboxylate transporter substrate binding protein n=1 Tax=Bosea sp. LjRoot9 TaxID=3342341 RepID=UPI003ECE4E49
MLPKTISQERLGRDNASSCITAAPARLLVHTLRAFAAAAMLYASPATSQDWPSRQVTVIVPFAPGSTPDIAARMVAERLQAKLGQPFVIENKPGASGNLGTASVARAEPDGHTIGVSIVGPLALNPLLFAKMTYDPKTELAPVTVLASQPSVLVVSKDLGVKSTQELIARLKRDASKLNFGSIGNGSLSHLAVEAIALKSNARPVHVPYNGSPAAVTALIRGDVQMAVLPASSVVPQAETGQIVLLAVTAARRSALLPDLPTLAEAGIAGVEVDSWIGLVAPARTSPAILAKLEREARQVLAEPAIREKLKVQYMEPVGNASQDFRALLDTELERWGPVIRANNIKLGQ